MSYPYQITSLAQYHEVYKQSIENPEKFWGDIAMHFRWKNILIKCSIGILPNPKLNGLKEVK